MFFQTLDLNTELNLKITLAPALKSWAVVKLLLICKFNQQRKLKIWLKVNTSQLYNQHIQFNHSSKNRAQMSIAFVLHLDDAHCFLFCSQWCLLFFVFQPMISLFFVLHCMVCYILLSAYDIYCFLFYTQWCVIIWLSAYYIFWFFFCSLWWTCGNRWDTWWTSLWFPPTMSRTPALTTEHRPRLYKKAGSTLSKCKLCNQSHSTDIYM